MRFTVRTSYNFLFAKNKNVASIICRPFPSRLGRGVRRRNLRSWERSLESWGGGPSPTEFDATEPPRRLDGVMIRSGDIIDAFGFSYADEASQKHTIGPYGGRGGSLTTVSKLCLEAVCLLATVFLASLICCNRDGICYVCSTLLKIVKKVN
jgi:hypothetical protein